MRVRSDPLRNPALAHVEEARKENSGSANRFSLLPDLHLQHSAHLEGTHERCLANKDYEPRHLETTAYNNR